MAAYRRVCDSRHLQADCQEPGSAPEPYIGYSSTGYLYLYTATHTSRMILSSAATEHHYSHFVRLSFPSAI